MIDQSYLYEIYTFKGNEIYCTYMYVYSMQYKYIIGLIGSSLKKERNVIGT